MTDNPFDQFDGVQDQQGTQPVPSANAFDKFDAPTQVAAATSSPQTSEGLGFYQGIIQPFDRAAEGAKWLANSTVPGLGDAIDKLGQIAGLPSTEQAVQGHENYIKQQETNGVQPGEAGRIGGEIASTLPTAALGPVAGGAVSGVLLGNSTTPTGIMGDAGIGAIGGKLGDMATNAIGSVISPQISKGVQLLKDMDVTLTPGQILGGWGKRLEDAATSIPFVGDAIQGAQRRSVLSFNRGAINAALTPIGETLPKSIPVGHEAVSYAGDRLSKAYSDLLPNLSIQADHTFADGINTARQTLNNLPVDKQSAFDQVMKDDVLGRFNMTPSGPTSANANLGGQDLKAMESRLGGLARSYSSSPLPDDRALGQAYGAVRNNLRDLVARNDPDAAAKLSKINDGYAVLTRIENAAQKANPTAGGGDAGGVFTPNQLQTAVRQGDTTIRNRAMARGDALLQNISEAGKSVLPSTVPDSGTARRLLASGTLLGGGGSLLHLLSPTTLGTVLGVAGAYSPASTRALQILLSERPALAPAIAHLVTSTARPLAIAGGATTANNATQ